jgi:hypothetical protein
MAQSPEAVTIIWDEGIDGDLSNDVDTPTPVFLVDTDNVIIGTVGTPAPEGAESSRLGPPAEVRRGSTDAYTFTVPAGFTMDAIMLESYVPAGGNTTTGFNLHTGIGTIEPQICFRAMGVVDIGLNLLAICDQGDISPLAPGEYTVALIEYTAPNQAYQLNHQVPGLPVELQSFSIE